MGCCCTTASRDSNTEVQTSPEDHLKHESIEPSGSAATAEPQSGTFQAEVVSGDQPSRLNVHGLKIVIEEGREAEDRLEFVLDDRDIVLSEEIKRLRSKPFDFSLAVGGVELRGIVNVAGGRYHGEWSGDQYEGRGVFYYDEGSLSEGYWSQSSLHGKARFITPFGTCYDGDWVKGKKHGLGTMITPEFTYTGTWGDDKQTGHGKETLTDGTVYEGEYLDGAKNGHGVLRWKEGSSYEGTFLNNQMHGQGHYKFADLNEYIGPWKQNLMHGQGKFMWKDGRVYEGDFAEGRKEGFGTITYPDGKVYVGNMKANRQHGEGQLTRNGKTHKGTWADGQLVKKPKKANA
jgi:hypothetical protein